MASIQVQVNGKKYKATATPMQPLSVIVEQVAAQLKPQPNVKECRLLYNKQPLDLSTPLRFANLRMPVTLNMTAPGHTSTLGIQSRISQPQPAAGDSAEFTASLPQQAGPSSSNEPPDMQSHPAGAAQQQPFPPRSAKHSPLQPLASTSVPSNAPPTQEQAPAPLAGTSHASSPLAASSSRPSAEPSLAGTPLPAAVDGSAGIAHGSNGTQDGGLTAATAGPSSSNSTEAARNSPEPVPERFAALGLSREVAVFTRQDLEAISAGVSHDDPPPEFYEFGLEDYARVTQGWSRAAKRAEAGLRTAKLREQEERQKAAKFPKCTLRIHFPDGAILQAVFGSLEELAAVRQLVQQCLAPGIPKWYIYTTPPKQVIKDYSCTLYRAGLVPAANLHFGIEEGTSGPFLRADILALHSAPPRPDAPKQEDAGAANGVSRGESHVGGSEFRPSSKEQTQPKVPKWMKLKK